MDEVRHIIYIGQVRVTGDWKWQDVKSSYIFPPFLSADKFVAEREVTAHARAWVRKRLREGVMSEWRIERKEVINSGTWVSEHYVEPRERNPVSTNTRSIAASASLARGKRALAND